MGKHKYVKITIADSEGVVLDQFVLTHCRRPHETLELPEGTDPEDVEGCYSVMAEASLCVRLRQHIQAVKPT